MPGRGGDRGGGVAAHSVRHHGGPAMAEEGGEVGRPLGGAAASDPRPGGLMPSALVGAVVIAGLYFGRPVLEPFALAALLSLMLAPAVEWLHHRGIGRTAAVVATVSLAFLVILGFAAAVGDEVIGLARNLPQYEDNIATKIRSLNGVVPGAGVLSRATQVFRDLGSELEGSTSGGPSAPLGAGAPGEAVPVP